MNTKPVVILVTCPNKKQARDIARALVESRLAACVNIAASVESIFRWQGKVTKANEALLIIKTKESKLAHLTRMIKNMHKYEVPEIIALPVTAGYKPYLAWIDESLRKSY
ncbi:divalent-cation tolerance protein CutA [Candidatus Omnitrophota bacterium]